jgi:2',3'-cyclic-nucleotide 2'-phosphodiesterase (5'-nucleotidase family)
MESGPRLRIVAVNDVYSLEHLPRLKTLIAHLGTTDPVDATLITVAGDFLAPSLLSSLDDGRGMVECLNALGVTHVTFGNHEDDIEVPDLHARIGELAATWLGTNLPEFSRRAPTTSVVAVRTPRHEVRVGVVGVVDSAPNVYRRPPFGGTRLMPANATALETARALHDEGAHCVIALTHQPLRDDRALAESEPRLALILGGHEHVPVFENLDFQDIRTPIAKAGMDGTHAIVAELRWSHDAASHAARPTVTARLEPVAPHAEDRPLRELVDRHMSTVKELAAAVILNIPAGSILSSVGSRRLQTTLGTLLCISLRDILGADACLFNGGGIRGSRTYEGAFTYADLETELPFDNEVVVVALPGHVIAAAIASSRAQAPAESGGFLQVDDRIVVDDSHRVTAIAGAPLAPDRDYRVALIRNMLLGMDRIAPLVDYATSHADRVPDEDTGREVKSLVVEAFGRRLAREVGGLERIDTDRDGAITVAELAAAIARGEGPATKALTRPSQMGARPST